MGRRYIGAKIEGLKELDRALKQLPLAVQKRVLRATLQKAGQPIVEDAQGRAPRLTGELAERITIKATLSRRQRRRMRKEKGAVVMFVGSTDPKAHLLEFGTEKMAARPFLRPSWDAGKAQVLATIRTELWTAIQKAARRLAKKLR